MLGEGIEPSNQQLARLRCPPGRPVVSGGCGCYQQPAPLRTRWALCSCGQCARGWCEWWACASAERRTLTRNALRSTWAREAEKNAVPPPSCYERNHAIFEGLPTLARVSDARH